MQRIEHMCLDCIWQISDFASHFDFIHYYLLPHNTQSIMIIIYTLSIMYIIAEIYPYFCEIPESLL